MVFSKIITAKQRAYALYLRRESNTSFQVIADKCRISKSSALRICGHQLLYAKKEIHPVLNSEQNANRECKLYHETANERKRIYHSASK